MRIVGKKRALTVREWFAPTAHSLLPIGACASRQLAHQRA